MHKEIIFYGTGVLDFYQNQAAEVQKKIDYVFDMVRFELWVPIKFFKKLEGTDGIYEIRVITSQKSIRFLCFMEEGRLLLLTNAFVKKTQKTPRQEIRLAEQLKSKYYKEKK